MARPYFPIQDINPGALLELVDENSPIPPALRLKGRAGQAITQFDVVYAASYSDGIAVFQKADADAATTAPGLLFLALNDAPSGKDLVVTLGPVNVAHNTLGATVGDAIYLSGTAGGVSTGAGTNVRKVGEVATVGIDGTYTFCGWMPGASSSGTTLDYLSIPRALTSGGEALRIQETINHATANVQGADIAVSQLTTARTSGTVDGVLVALTSLAGDSGGTYNNLNLTVTDGGGTTTHNAVKIGAGFDAVIDGSSCATGQFDLVVGANLADALSLRTSSLTYLTLKTTTATPNFASSLALTAAGNAWDIDATINHATGAMIGLDVSATQLTTPRTAGTVTGVKSTVTSLSGDTAGVDYYAFQAAVTVGEANADHYVLKVGAGFDALMDLTSCATGEAGIVVNTGLASAFSVGTAGVPYIDVATAIGGQKIIVNRPILISNVPTVDMADGTHSLVWTVAGAGETQITGNFLNVDPNSSGAGEDLQLPPVASSAGLSLTIFNVGGENIVVKDSTGGTTYGTIATTKAAQVVCNGSTWSYLAGA